MASRALMFRRCRKLQRHVLILLDRKLADASNGRRFFLPTPNQRNGRLKVNAILRKSMLAAL